MTPLAFIFSLLFVFQQPQSWPQVNPFTDSVSVRDEWLRAYAKFKPGPRVQAELEKLRAREREALNLWSDSEYTLQDINREVERTAISRHLLLCMALVVGESDRVPDLIVVLANTRDIMKVFPSGKLPADSLQLNTVYETEPGSKRRVRYLTLFRWDSKVERFAVFAHKQEP